jgi:chemotaxis protein MotB
MAEKPVIIIKKIKKGGHAAHGGAWKVALADFMTAMMAFFLVMWLVNADEEVKQSVSDYFNNPTSAFRPDLSSDRAIPLGNKTGAGDDVLRGADGFIPEDIVVTPSEAQRESQANAKEMEKLTDLFHDQLPGADLNIEHLRFSLPEHFLFRPGSNEFTPQAAQYLSQIGRLINNYKGYVTVKSFVSPAPAGLDHPQQAYEFSMTRSVAVMKHLVQNKLIDEERVLPSVGRERQGGSRGISSNHLRDSARALEITLSLEKPTL